MNHISLSQFIRIILRCTLAIIISVLCLISIKMLTTSNRIPISNTIYSERISLSQNDHFSSAKCEIVTDINTPEYLRELRQTYPSCKIIEKTTLYQTNLIDQLIHFFK